MQTVNTPCKGCGERAEGCHGVCDRYKAWAAEWQKRKKPHVEIDLENHTADKIEKRRRRLNNHG